MINSTEQFEKLLNEVLAPAVERLKHDRENQDLLIQKGEPGHSRVVLNGQRFRYHVGDGEHSLTSERRAFEAGGRDPMLTIKLSGDTLTYENLDSGNRFRVEGGELLGTADAIFFELYELSK